MHSSSGPVLSNHQTTQKVSCKSEEHGQNDKLTPCMSPGAAVQGNSPDNSQH